jgi:hypothetical protein
MLGSKGRRIAELEAEREDLQRRLASGIAVAAYWRDAALAELARNPAAVSVTHPLACALMALAGEETEPRMFGIPDHEYIVRIPEAEAAIRMRVAPEAR